MYGLELACDSVAMIFPACGICATQIHAAGLSFAK